ncbi:hypothetical protein EV2_006993 [Malus domestica]
MLIDQEDTKAAKEMARTVAAEAYSMVEKVKKLESELTALKGSNISTLTSVQLEIAPQKIMDLKTRLDVIQAGAAGGEASDSAAAEGITAAEYVAIE